MNYNKLPPQPPAYTDQPGWSVPPSAPPSAMPLYPQAPAAPAVENVTVVRNTVVVDNGQGMICPHCQARIRMRVEHHATCSTYLLAGLLCLFLCWPCVCLPCCCNCGYKTSQFCPNCNACLGSF
ncbi:hypothetical protein KR222_011750 [Zaprionus bogoriensis]|nr:hypothetical protein KR222_011750 [Zaprionus bogoriensis]